VSPGKVTAARLMQGVGKVVVEGGELVAITNSLEDG
jgi:hypothetical protein